MSRAGVDRLVTGGHEPAWEEVRQSFIFAIKGKADAMLLEQRMQRITQRDGEPFRVYIGRAYDELVKVLGTRPNDGQLTRVVVAGANIPTTREIQRYRDDATTLWELQDLIEEWEQTQWRVLGLPDPFHDATRAIPESHQESQGTTSSSSLSAIPQLDRKNVVCGWCGCLVSRRRGVVSLEVSSRESSRV